MNLAVGSYFPGLDGQFEIATGPGAVLVRDTTQHGHGPVLRVSAETWQRFIAAIRG